jgi:CheY-like chemotaxis protein
MSFDAGELFTASVRRVVPLLFEKKLACSFDCRGPRVIVAGDPSAVRCSLHRLMCGLIDLVDVGFVVLHAHTRLRYPNKCALSVKLAATGMLAHDAWADRVMQRLGLADDMPSTGERTRLRRASGPCPDTGATVRFASLPGEGVLFTIDWVFNVDAIVEDAESADAQQARAWIIDDDEVGRESLARRLERLGWATAHFDGPTPVARRLRTMPATNARPALLVAVECGAVSPESVQCLRAHLPSWTSAIYAVQAGSPTLSRPGGVPGFALRVLPLSPLELHAVTVAVPADTELPSGETQPAPLLLGDRPLMLVADAHECVRVAATAIAEALGYAVRVSDNGGDALTQCSQLSPAVVLLDLALPGADGTSVARRLRELERSRAAVPSVILGLAAKADGEVQCRCTAAGMDGVLVKPLSLSHLRAELRRLCAGAQAVTP